MKEQSGPCDFERLEQLLMAVKSATELVGDSQLCGSEEQIERTASTVARIGVLIQRDLDQL